MLPHLAGLDLDDNMGRGSSWFRFHGLGEVFCSVMFAHFEQRLAVGPRQKGRRAVVEVDDDGPGLPARELNRVFEPFHRAERSRSRATGGTGLGLAVVRAVVLAHGGEATLENRQEGGLRARINLPF